MLNVGMIFLSLALFVIIAWLRPRIALGVLLASIPFYEITRFTIAGIPFTFPEVATYTIATALLLRWKFETRISKFETNSKGRNSKRWMFRLFDHLNFKFQISNFVRNPWNMLPILWVLTATIAASYSPAGARAWGAWKGFFVAPVILYFVIRYFYHSAAASSGRNHESRIKNQGDDSDPIIHNSLFIIRSLAIGAFLVSTIAVVQWWWPIGVPYPWSVPGKFRSTSVFGYPNAVGLFLAPIIPLFVGAAIVLLSPFRAERAAASVVEKSHTQSCASNGVRSFASLRMTRYVIFSFFLFTSLLALIAIILAKSTGALIALAVVTLMTAGIIIARRQKNPYPKILGREKLGTRVAIGIVLVWVLASIAITGALPYKRDLERIQNPIVRKLAFGAWSGSVRLEQYRETWPMLLDNPIRGIGLTGYKQAFAPYHHSTVEIFPYPHNLLLAVWSELGLAGIVIFLLVLYQVICATLSPPPNRRGSERGWRLGMFAAILVLLIHGLVDVPYFKNDLSTVFWVIAALALTQAGLDRKAKIA